MKLSKHQRSVIHGTQQNSNSSKPPTLFFQLMERLKCFFGRAAQSHFSPSSIMHPRYLSAFVCRGLLNCGTERRLYSFMGREEGVTGSFVCVGETVHAEHKHTVSLWFLTSVLCPDTVRPGQHSQLVVYIWHQPVSLKLSHNLLLFSSQPI